MNIHDFKLEFDICDPFDFKQSGVIDKCGQNNGGGEDAYVGELPAN